MKLFIVLIVGCLECGAGRSDTEISGAFTTREAAEAAAAAIPPSGDQEILVLEVPAPTT